jgi:CelD/BcsL family acetyltransferase involved in cellulose biosynthesis
MLHIPDQFLRDSVALTARAAVAVDLSESLIAEMTPLAHIASEPSAFCEGWFLGAALRHLRSGSDIRLIEVRGDDGALIGVMALCIAQNYGRVPVKHVSNWMHYQCFMGSPLVHAGYEASFWRAVIDLLDRSDWATGLLRIAGLLEDGPLHMGLVQAARSAPTIHRYTRAALASDLTPEAYLDATMRPKKRKELRRLANRLADSGDVTFAVLEDAGDIDAWCDDFLTLEASGWKGARGAALGNRPATAAFFREVVRGAFEAGRLDFQRLTLDGRAIAMLVNFRTPPGSWSFKIAYDESLSRFSPGVLIELENLPRVLNDPEVDWMDSCAIENHPMINSLWGERRSIIQVAVPLSGIKRTLTYRACRAAENTSAWLRSTRAETHD